MKKPMPLPIICGKQIPTTAGRLTGLDSPSPDAPGLKEEADDDRRHHRNSREASPSPLDEG